MFPTWKAEFPAGRQPRIFKPFTKAGREAGRWWDSWWRGSWETILVLTKYGTMYRPGQHRSWTADQGRCCPSSKGTGSTYRACSVNLSKNLVVFNDRGAHLILKTLHALTGTSLESLLMRRCADMDVYKDSADVIWTVGWKLVSISANYQLTSYTSDLDDLVWLHLQLPVIVSFF